MFDFVVSSGLDDNPPEKPKRFRQQGVHFGRGFNSILRNEDIPKKLKQWLRPSALYFDSVEKIVLNMFKMMPKDKVDTKSYLKMAQGKALHLAIQNKLYYAGCLRGSVDENGDYQEQFFENPKTGFHGMCDGIIDTVSFCNLYKKAKKDAPEESVLEIKTVPDRKFREILSTDDIPEWTKWQAEIYMQEYAIPHVLFLFVNTDSLTGKFLRYDFDGRPYSEAMEKADLIRNHVISKTLPDYELVTNEEWGIVLEEHEKAIESGERTRGPLEKEYGYTTGV